MHIRDLRTAFPDIQTLPPEAQETLARASIEQLAKYLGEFLSSHEDAKKQEEKGQQPVIPPGEKQEEFATTEYKTTVLIEAQNVFLKYLEEYIPYIDQQSIPEGFFQLFGILCKHLDPESLQTLLTTVDGYELPEIKHSLTKNLPYFYQRYSQGSTVNQLLSFKYFLKWHRGSIQALPRDNYYSGQVELAFSKWLSQGKFDPALEQLPPEAILKLIPVLTTGISTLPLDFRNQDVTSFGATDIVFWIKDNIDADLLNQNPEYMNEFRCLATEVLKRLTAFTLTAKSQMNALGDEGRHRIFSVANYFAALAGFGNTTDEDTQTAPGEGLNYLYGKFRRENTGIPSSFAQGGNPHLHPAIWAAVWLVATKVKATLESQMTSISLLEADDLEEMLPYLTADDLRRLFMWLSIPLKIERSAMQHDLKFGAVKSLAVLLESIQQYNPDLILGLFSKITSTYWSDVKTGLELAMKTVDSLKSTTGKDYAYLVMFVIKSQRYPNTEELQDLEAALAAES